MRIRRRPDVVDSYDAGLLRRASLRTRFLRVFLVAVAVALLALATASARGLKSSPQAVVPGSTGVLVVDLSLSISGNDYGLIRRTVRRLIDSHASVGLVIFSDVAYELLPPGTPASELRPLLRLLMPHRGGPPITPWALSFRAGTRISSALVLAQQMLHRDHIQNGYIILLSDLITAPEDIPALVRELQQLHLESYRVRVVPLAPLPDSLAIVKGLLGERAFIPPSQLRGSKPLHTTGRAALPVGFLLAGALLLAVLAAHERFAGRLGLPRARRSEA